MGHRQRSQDIQLQSLTACCVAGGVVVSTAIVLVATFGCEGSESRRVAAASPRNPEANALPVSEAAPKPPEKGRWIRPRQIDPTLDPQQREMIEQLEAIGYANGSVLAGSRAGVTLHDRIGFGHGRWFSFAGMLP